MPIFSPRLNYNGTDTLDYYTSANPFYTAYEYNPDTGVYEWLWMPNCTAYAFGRFNELAQEHNLNYRWPTGNGDSWYAAAPGKGLLRGQVPALGAAMCWSYPSDPDAGGHVAIVEQLITDSLGNITQIVISNSAFNHYDPPRYPQNAFPWFYLDYVDPNNLDHGWHFNGFVYHPNYPPGVLPIDTAAFISSIISRNDRKGVKIIRRRRY